MPVRAYASTPLRQGSSIRPCEGQSKDFLKAWQPMGQISQVKDIVDAIVYLTEAEQVTGEVLHVDGGAHVGKW